MALSRQENYGRARGTVGLIPIFLIAAIALAYANTLHAPFLFDDYNAILSNDHLTSILPLSRSMSTPPQSVLDGRPLVCLSLAINYALGGVDPVGYHLFNIATHVACGLLLYGLVRRTWLLQGESGPWFAASIALVWALHPMQTEAVTYVTQRTETMFSMFLLLMLYALARSAQSPRPLVWQVIAAASCVLGMACKEIMIVAPILAVLYDWIFLPRRPRRYIMHAAFCAAWIFLYLNLRNVDFDSKSGYGLKYVNWFDYLKTEAGVIVYYLRVAFWPRGLEIDYFDWPIVQHLSSAILPGLFLTALFFASAVACWRRWWPGFLGAWFFLILGPTSSVLPNRTEIAAERRMYLPLAAIVILVLAAGRLATKNRALRIAAVMAIALALGGLTFARNAEYNSPITLWTDAVTQRTNNPRAHFWLGWSYAKQNDWDHATAEDARALEISPNFRGAIMLKEYIRQNAPAIPTTRPDTRALLPGLPEVSPPNPPK
jgi:protein O-mannosyl-transferase